MRALLLTLLALTTLQAGAEEHHFVTYNIRSCRQHLTKLNVSGA